ncbi:MAG: hypothetical protein M3220_14405 [Chloroflexota bacterium]|nr:hypothetical protein [Chloroflexota bacterium]
MPGTNANSDQKDSAGEAHEAMRELLPDYATVEACGNDPAAQYPEMAAHLETCEACRDELEELLELLIPAYTGQVDPAPSYPTPNLSFLKKDKSAPTPAKPWLVDEMGRLWIRFSQTLLDTLRPPSLAGAMRGQLLYTYELEPGSVPDLDVGIEIFAEENSDNTATINVIVDDQRRDPLDQSGITVTLHAAGTTWQEETDEAGCAMFEGVPRSVLAKLEVEVARI